MALPDYMGFLDNLFGPVGSAGYLDSLLSEADLGSLLSGAEPGRPAPAGVDMTGAFSDYAGTVRHREGGDLDAGVVRHLAGQIAPNLDLGRSRGGAFSTSKAPIGFEYDEVRKLFKADPTAAQQVVMDMAANLAGQGVTDISQLTTNDEKYQYELGARTDWANGQMVDATRKVLARRGADGALTNLGPGFGVTHMYDGLGPRKATAATPEYFGRTYEGKGGTSYGVDVGPDGGLKFYTAPEETSDAGAIGALLSVATLGLASPFAASIQGAMPSLGTVGSKALAGGILNGTTNAAVGGKFGKGFLGGAVGGAVSAMNPAGYFGVTDKVGGAALNGAVGGAARAAVTGGDVGRGLLSGAAGGAVAGLNPAGRLGVEDAWLRRILNSGAAGLAGGVVGGADPRGALLNGALSGALSGAARPATGR